MIYKSQNFRISNGQALRNIEMKFFLSAMDLKGLIWRTSLPCTQKLDQVAWTGKKNQRGTKRTRGWEK